MKNLLRKYLRIECTLKRKKSIHLVSSMYVCVPEYMYVYDMYAGTHKGQKGLLDSCELKSQVVLNYLI